LQQQGPFGRSVNYKEGGKEKGSESMFKGLRLDCRKEIGIRHSHKKEISEEYGNVNELMAKVLQRGKRFAVGGVGAEGRPRANPLQDVSAIWSSVEQ